VIYDLRLRLRDALENLTKGELKDAKANTKANGCDS